MIEPQVILVNTQDQVQGSLGKLAAHQQGLLHRAFSIFLLRQENGAFQTLLQRRALSKYHSGGLWTNTCCSHPAPEQDLIISAQQRLLAEFGLNVPLTDIGQFIYKAPLDHGLIEHELDHVLIGLDEGQIPKPDPEEIMDWRWCDLTDLAEALSTEPRYYTAWIGTALTLVQQHLK